MVIPSPQIPSPYAPPPPRSSPLKWIVIGCLGLMLLGGVGIGGCLFAVIKATAAPVEAAESFLRAMNKGDFAEAKKFCDASIDPKLVRDIYPGAWGPSWSITERSISVNNGTSTARVSATMTGTDGKARSVHMVLQKTGSAWLVAGLSPDGLASAEEGATAIGDPEIVKKKTAEGWDLTFKFRVTGLKSEARANNHMRVSVSEDAVLIGPQKKEVFRKEDFVTIDDEAESPYVTLTNTIPVTGAVDGHWTLKVTAKDRLSGKSATRDFEFDIP